MAFRAERGVIGHRPGPATIWLRVMGGADGTGQFEWWDDPPTQPDAEPAGGWPDRVQHGAARIPDPDEPPAAATPLPDPDGPETFTPPPDPDGPETVTPPPDPPWRARVALSLAGPRSWLAPGRRPSAGLRRRPSGVARQRPRMAAAVAAAAAVLTVIALAWAPDDGDGPTGGQPLPPGPLPPPGVTDPGGWAGSAPPTAVATNGPPAASPTRSAPPRTTPTARRPPPRPTPPPPAPERLPPTSYEAESGANVLRNGARVAGHDDASGGLAVYAIGAGNLGTLEFRGISAPADGMYEVTIFFHNPNQGGRVAYISVNGQAPVAVWFGPTGSCCVEATTVTARLDAGASNTMMFANPDERAPDIDRIVVASPPA